MSDNQEQSPLDTTTQDAESKNEETPITSKDVVSETKKKSSSPSDELPKQVTKLNVERKQFLDGLVFFGGLFLFFVTTFFLYFRLHGVDLFVVVKSNEAIQAAIPAITNYDFIGAPAPPSTGSIMFEVGTWSLLGVTIRTIYRASTAIRRKRFGLLDYTVRFVGDAMIAFGITIAVVFFLRITTISIAGAELNLADASFETIVAIAFILGFFYEDTLRLLGEFKEKIISSAGQELDKESTENNKEK